MIKKILPVIILIFFVSPQITAQYELYERVKKEYVSFEYEKVIELSEEITKTKILSDSLLIDTYLMRAASFYALGNEPAAKQNFLETLHINKNYSPDPSNISPKLISLFNEVKSEFINQFSPQTDQLQKPKNFIFDDQLLRNAIIKNTFVPGWGQLSSGITVKGAVLSILSTANLAGMIFYIYDSNKKENDYLKETNKSLIQQKYNDFNKSYKIRNTMIAAYAVVWLYSQIDILFFNDSQIFLKEIIDNESISFHNEKDIISLSFKIPF